jgi:3-oxoacyl-[acyl-carrier-protein] synthase III
MEPSRSNRFLVPPEAPIRLPTQNSEEPHKKLTEKKEELLKAAVAKYDAIVRALRNEVNMTKERMDYLNALNILLQAAIRDLKADLGKAS